MVAALLELHQKVRAHLHIRRENICYDNHDQVQLIDLDRNCSISKEPLHLSFKYGVAVLYTCPIGFKTVDNDELLLNLKGSKKFHFNEYHVTLDY